MKKAISTNKAPAAVGPYVQGVQFNNLVFVSGQIPLNPETGAPEPGDIKAQTRRSMDNLVAILQAGGADVDTILKTTLFVADMNDFAAINEVYASYFSGSLPARSCLAAKSLPKGVNVEIEAIAYVK